MARDSRIVN